MGTRRRKSEWPDYYDKVWCKERGEGGNCLLSLLPLFLSNVYHTHSAEEKEGKGIGRVRSDILFSQTFFFAFPFHFGTLARSLASQSPFSRIGGNEKRCFRPKRERERFLALSMFSSLMRLSGLVSVTRVEPIASDSNEVPEIPKGSLLLS